MVKHNKEIARARIILYFSFQTSLGIKNFSIIGIYAHAVKEKDQPPMAINGDMHHKILLLNY